MPTCRRLATLSSPNQDAPARFTTMASGWAWPLWLRHSALHRGSGWSQAASGPAEDAGEAAHLHGEESRVACQAVQVPAGSTGESMSHRERER